jgi:hypothetical protein
MLLSPYMKSERGSLERQIRNKRGVGVGCIVAVGVKRVVTCTRTVDVSLISEGADLLLQAAIPININNARRAILRVKL